MSGTGKRNTNAKRRLFGKQTEESEEIHHVSQTAVTRNEGGHEAVTILDDTPQKKSKSHHDFFSPKGKPVVTPDKVEDDEVEAFSPPPKKIRLSELYSPTQQREVRAKEDGYIPTYIHKNLSYKRQGTASLPPNVKATFDLVQKHYEIPHDFEQSRSYGPLSGTSFEERVISAYNLSLLEPKNGEDLQICSSCVTVGHKRNDCPDLI